VAEDGDVDGSRSRTTNLSISYNFFNTLIIKPFVIAKDCNNV
jgi:hypothetical protein